MLNSKFSHHLIMVRGATELTLDSWSFTTIKVKDGVTVNPLLLYLNFPSNAKEGDQIAIRYSSGTSSIPTQTISTPRGLTRSGGGGGINLSLVTFGQAEQVQLCLGQTVIWVYCPNQEPKWRLLLSGTQTDGTTLTTGTIITK